MPRKPDINKKNRYNTPFPTALRALMDETNTTQEELKEILSLQNRQSVTGYIDGETLPTIDKVVAIANHFNVSADWLLGLSTTRSQDSSIRSVSDLTGLTEKAVSNLCEVSYKVEQENNQLTTGNSLSPLLELESFMKFLYGIDDLRNASAELSSFMDTLDSYENDFEGTTEERKLLLGDSLEERAAFDGTTAFEYDCRSFYEWFRESRLLRYELSETLTNMLEKLLPTFDLIEKAKLYARKYGADIDILD